MTEGLFLLGIYGFVLVLTFLVGIKLGKGLKYHKEIDKLGFSFEKLMQAHKEKYECAKKADNERESLILASESLLYRKLADKHLNNR
jgi:hypothetical protein